MIRSEDATVEEDNPVEQVTEEIHHSATHSKDRWVSWVALTTALLAGIAALGSSMSNHHESEGTLAQIKASDQWAWYQADGIKRHVLEATHPESKDVERYRSQQQKRQDEAAAKEAESERHMHLHGIYANAVMFSQIAIAVAAISVLMRRPQFWLVSLAFGAVGLGFLVYGLVV